MHVFQKSNEQINSLPICNNKRPTNLQKYAKTNKNLQLKEFAEMMKMKKKIKILDAT